MSASSLDGNKEKRLLRKASYWLRDYASCFNKDETPGVRKFRDKIRKLAADCMKAGR